MLADRLVGHVEHDVLKDILLLEILLEFHKKCTQKADVFVGQRIGVPTEKLLVLSVHGRHDFRRMLSAPLGK